jgi:beta-galactosidase
MDRRDFLKTTSTLLASTALPSIPAFAAEDAPTGRTILPINRNWRYHPSKLEGAHATAFNDASFQRVIIPHTNIALPWHNFDDRQYEFISTYRRHFKTPAEARGRRIFLDFEGAMTASTVWINGTSLGEYKGGYTPFSFELTKHLKPVGAENVLTVELDSTERADIPPFGHQIDYLTFGGIYREVALRIVPQTWLDNIFARPKDVLSNPSLDVDCFLAGAPAQQLTLEVELRDGDRTIAKNSATIDHNSGSDPNSAADPATSGPVYQSTQTINDPARHTVTLDKLSGIQLWDLDTPHLYTVHVRLAANGKTIDEDTRRIGFREAVFTPQGFSINGKVVKLRGLDRHQTFPFVGQAMPGRVQRQDADILRLKYHCNIVRTSHYPQSRHFLDRCDEIGLLVLEEIPGWQHIGDEPWKQIAIDNVGRMIRRDWNHPAIVLWGVRINESRDDHDFYVRTNKLAHLLDTTRQTGGIRNFKESELIEDVFTINDFGFPLREPNHPLYLNTEFVGHTFPTKTIDEDERQREHTLRHARIHNQLAGNPQYAGGIGWCAFDYNTHADFGSGDRICYHGVFDIFREPKAAAGFYKSQCDPAKEVVLEPAFHWAIGDESTHFTEAVICSNCDHLKLFVRANGIETNPWTPLIELDPDREEFAHLKYPPFIYDRTKQQGGGFARWGDLRIDGYLNGKLVISKTLSGRGDNKKLSLVADDTKLHADGADTTRVVMRITDEFGNPRPFADDAITLKLEGPAILIGDNPFALMGGQGAVWIRATELPGTIRLAATHSVLGSQSVTITTTPTQPERV